MHAFVAGLVVIGIMAVVLMFIRRAQNAGIALGVLFGSLLWVLILHPFVR